MHDREAKLKFWQSVAFVDTDQLLALARLSDGLGYHGMMVSDHVFFPRELDSSYPYSPTGKPMWDSSAPWPDPWVLIGALAAATSNLRFSTNIYVAPARHPFVVAKAVSTAAVLSGNRVALGVGAGWMREEFDAMGQDFSNRGARLEEMIPLLRRLWEGGMVEHHGRHYDFASLEMSPAPTLPVPIYGGGQSPAALRRAARLCNGWIGNAYPVDDAFDWVRRVRKERDDVAGRAEPFEIILGVMAMPDPDLLKRLEDAGVTGVLCAPWLSHSVTAGPESSARADIPVDPASRRSYSARAQAVEKFAELVIERMA
ncbi:MAG: TIGR03619 family F420-dependent LLM class oxidoreductase [Acidimicrobiales bacterium]